MTQSQDISHLSEQLLLFFLSSLSIKHKHHQSTRAGFLLEPLRRCVNFMEWTATEIRAYVRSASGCGSQLFGCGIIWVKMFSPVFPSEPCSEGTHDGPFLFAVCLSQILSASCVYPGVSTTMRKKQKQIFKKTFAWC